MKFFTNKELSKKIIIAILLIMSFNFISPTISKAKDKDEFGGALFQPIAEFVITVADLVMSGLQGFFIGDAEISFGGFEGTGTDTFYIRYSPGIIFSGEVAGLKVNFIDAKESDKKDGNITKLEWDYIEDFNDLDDLEEYGFDESAADTTINTTNNDWYDLATPEQHTMITWRSSKDNQIYGAVISNKQYDGNFLWFGGEGFNIWRDIPLIELIGALNDSIDDLISEDTKCKIYKRVETAGDPIYRSSSAYLLQDTVATWYKALRAIALVGLLSVLVYVGIRILISSTGQEKAKYKKMIIDWLTAICILFVLQYIMIFIIEISQQISDVLKANVMGKYGEDIIISDLRNRLETDVGFSTVFPELLIYVTVAIYTVMFTVQYLKRLVYMAFFTLISPLIALTYPLDKIKDGQAQAFTTWIREYIFNALLQPMHLLLYYIFVTSAVNLVNENMLYALVAIGFLLPAEKFFRKMFGFEKAASANPIGAAVGGALIMNAINKMGHISGKKAAGSSKGAGDKESGGSTPRYAAAPDGSKGGNSGAEASPGGDAGGENASTGGRYGQTSSSPRYNVRNSLKGAKTLGGRYGVKALKGLGRLGVGAAGAATLGTVGMAAGIATGDISNAFKYGAAGAGAGYMGANGLVDKAGSVARGVGEEVRGARDAFEVSALGTDEHNTRSSIRELEKDDNFNRMCDNLNITNKGELIREFHNQGIKNTADIKKSVDIMAKTGASQNEIVQAHQVSQQAKKYGMKPEDIKNSLKSKGYDDKIINKTVDLVDRLM